MLLVKFDVRRVVYFSHKSKFHVIFTHLQQVNLADLNMLNNDICSWKVSTSGFLWHLHTIVNNVYISISVVTL